MENDRVGYSTATPDWSDYFSFTRFASNLTLVERCSGRLTKRIKKRFYISLWPACRKSWRAGIDRLHSSISSSASGHFLFGSNLDAISPSSAADLCAALEGDIE